MKKTLEQIKQEANEKLAVQTYKEVKVWMNKIDTQGAQKHVA